MIPDHLRQKYEVHEWGHACAILAADFPEEWSGLLALLDDFRLCQSWIISGGGNKSRVADAIDRFLAARGWREKKFDTAVTVDEVRKDSPTHKVDCFKNRVALEAFVEQQGPLLRPRPEQLPPAVRPACD